MSQPQAEIDDVVQSVPLTHPLANVQTRMRIYSHSSLLFWWPVWLVGYVMAGLTFWHGNDQPTATFGQALEWVHPGNNLGVIFFLTIYLIIMITNFSVRGLASGMVIMAAALVTVILAMLECGTRF